jgi:hypothetical protein
MALEGPLDAVDLDEIDADAEDPPLIMNVFNDLVIVIGVMLLSNDCKCI